MKWVLGNSKNKEIGGDSLSIVNGWTGQSRREPEPMKGADHCTGHYGL